MSGQRDIVLYKFILPNSSPINNPVDLPKAPFMTVDSIAPQSPPKTMASSPLQSIDGEPSAISEPDDRSPIAKDPSPEAKEVFRLKQALRNLQDEHFTAQSSVSQCRDEIERLREKHQIAEQASTTKRLELQNLEAQRRGMLQTIKKTKHEREELLSAENLCESNLRIGLSRLQPREDDVRRLSAFMEAVQGDLKLAQQQLALRAEIADDSLRELAEHIRGFQPRSPKQENGRLSEEVEFEQKDISRVSDTNQSKWQRLGTEDATVADFVDLSGFFDSIDRKMKRKSTDSSMEDETTQTEKQTWKSDDDSEGRVSELNSILDHTGSPLEMTAKAFKHDLERTKHHAERIKKFMLALSGDERKRKVSGDDHYDRKRKFKSSPDTVGQDNDSFDMAQFDAANDKHQRICFTPYLDGAVSKDASDQ